MLEIIKSSLSPLSAYLLDKLVPALLIFVVGFIGVRLVMRLADKAFTKLKEKNPSVSLLLSVIRLGLYLALFFCTTSALGIDMTGALALASVLTLAISLAVQDALANLIGGFTLLYTQAFDIGDFVQIDNESGTVQQIGLTYTKLLTADGKIVSIPNNVVDSAQIVNFSEAGKRRVEIAVSASYDSDPELVIQTLLELAKGEDILHDPEPAAILTEYADSVIRYKLMVWTVTDNYWDVTHSINRKLKPAFDQAGIVMSYPHLNVHVNP